MYDSFDMACHDEDPDLRLNIKVNSENLLPIPQKYNLGSLRLPADPSWPKIPQRKLADDVRDLIQPPRIVTSTGTPRRSRTIVRTPQSQSFDSNASKDSNNIIVSHRDCNSSQNNIKIQQNHQLRSRKIGCADPRFKKVTTAVRNQMTSTDPGDDDKIDEKSEFNRCTMRKSKELEKSVNEEETGIDRWKESTRRAQVILQQEAERPDETKGKESIGIQTMEIESLECNDEMKEGEINSCIKSNEQNSAVRTESRRKSRSPDKTSENFEDCVSLKNDSKDRSGVEKTAQSILRSSQEMHGQFFSVIEKKSRTFEPVSSGRDNQSLTQNNSHRRVPVLSYENVPVEITSETKSKVAPADDIPDTQLFDSSNSKLKSETIFGNNVVNIPKLELPENFIPKFPNFIDHSNPRGETFFGKRDQKEKPADNSKLREKTELKKRDENAGAINFQLNFSPDLIIGENHRAQFKSVRKNSGKRDDDKVEKYRQEKDIFDISGDNFIPKHNFHIYYHEGKRMRSQGVNGPKKLRDIVQSSPRYQTLVTTDSEADKKRGCSIDENNYDRISNRKDQLVEKKTNCVYNEEQITDSESHASDVANERSTKAQRIIIPNEIKRGKNYSTNLFDSNEERIFQCSNQKTVYFEQNQFETRTEESKDKTLAKYEQCRAASSSRQKRKIKSEQRLMINKKRVQSSEPQITGNRRLSRTSCLKKANSYLSKSTKEVTPDSEFSYVVQNQDFRPLSSCDVDEISRNKMKNPTDPNEIKREHCMKPYERPSSKSAKNTSSSNLKKRINSASIKSPRGETDLPMIEKPTAIPVKTQQLLNKSYWEYYNKLKLEKMDNGESPQQQYFCQVAMGAPRSKKRRTPEEIVEESNCKTSLQTREQMELSLPEIRTLEQCSVLSTMINKTLDSTILQPPSSETIQTKEIYLNGNMRSSSDPTAGTESAILKKLFSGENEDSILSSTLVHKQKHNKREKKIDNGKSKLKSITEHPIVFFGCMAYALIVFLPMVYDYFFYEEHDEYEDLSYIEIFFDYLIVSFKEALGEFLEMMNKIFFKPELKFSSDIELGSISLNAIAMFSLQKDARMQRLSSGKWRQKISRHHLI